MRMKLDRYVWYIIATLIAFVLFMIFFIVWCSTYHDDCVAEFLNGILLLWFTNIVVLYVIGFYFYTSAYANTLKVRGFLLLGYSIYFVLYSIYAFSVGVGASSVNGHISGWTGNYAINIAEILLLFYTPYIYIHMLFLKKLNEIRVKVLWYILYIILLIWLIILLVFGVIR